MQRSVINSAAQPSRRSSSPSLAVARRTMPGLQGSRRRWWTTRRSQAATILSRGCSRRSSHEVEPVILAGFMRILTPYFPERFSLPHRQPPPVAAAVVPWARPRGRLAAKSRRLLNAFVTAVVDEGPLLMQGVVPLHSDDALEDFAARSRMEHRLPPATVAALASVRCARWTAASRPLGTSDVSDRTELTILLFAPVREPTDTTSCVSRRTANASSRSFSGSPRRSPRRLRLWRARGLHATSASPNRAR